MSTNSSISPLLSSASSTGNSAIDLSNILAAGTGASTSGIDVKAAVAAAIYAARAPERLWQADQATLSNQATALTNIQSATEAVYDDLQSLNTLTGVFAARTVSSANTNYVRATAAAGTAAGVHSVVVRTLATAGAWYSDLQSSPIAMLPSSSMTLTTASGSITISTGSGATGDTLNDLATAINGAKLGVTATVMSDSSGSRLAIVSNTAGVANDFSITSQSATGTSWTSDVLPSGATLGANSVTLSNSSGATLTVNSVSGQSYADYAAAINQAVSAYNAASTTPLNVTATASSSASGSRLSITSTDGSPFSIDEPAIGFTQANAATNATGTIDGVPFDSSSNTLSGEIPGVTFSLLASTQGSAVALTVAPDVSQMSGAISQLVANYNTAINLVNAQFKLTSSTDESGNTTKSEGVLASDSTVRRLQSTLGGALGYVYTPSSGTTSVPTLASLGITLNNDGTLSVNNTTLNNALTTNFSDVQNFFQGTALNGFANHFYTTLNTFTSPANGAFTVDLQSIQAQSRSLAQEISDFESGYIASQTAILTSDFSKAEIALQRLPQLMQQLNAQLGFNSSRNG